MSQELAVIEAGQAELTVNQLVGQKTKIQQAMAAVMEDGQHYGVIPGTNKPTLYKPGAEALCLLFRFDPEYEYEERWEPHGHYTVSAKCTLFHIPTGMRVASGPGLCTTRESRYAFRDAKRACPSCNQETIVKGKQQYGGGWICFKKLGGCGAKFADGDSTIEDQKIGKVENDALADTYNTVLKMACKRALVAAVLNGTAASDIFTQDLEDLSGTEPASDGNVPEPQEDARAQTASQRKELDGLLEEIGQHVGGPPEGVESWAAYAEAQSVKWFDAPSETLNRGQMATLVARVKAYRDSLQPKDEIPF